MTAPAAAPGSVRRGSSEAHAPALDVTAGSAPAPAPGR